MLTTASNQTQLEGVGVVKGRIPGHDTHLTPPPSLSRSQDVPYPHPHCGQTPVKSLPYLVLHMWSITN